MAACVYPGYLESLVKCQDDHKDAFIVCGYNKVFTDSDKRAFVYDDHSKVSSLQLSEYMLLFNKELIQTPYCKLFQTSVIKKKRIIKVSGRKWKIVTFCIDKNRKIKGNKILFCALLVLKQSKILTPYQMQANKMPYIKKRATKITMESR